MSLSVSLVENLASIVTVSSLPIRVFPLLLTARMEVTTGAGIARSRATWFRRPGVAFFSSGEATQLAGSPPGSEKLTRSSDLPRYWYCIGSIPVHFGPAPIESAPMGQGNRAE